VKNRKTLDKLGRGLLLIRNNDDSAEIYIDNYEIVVEPAKLDSISHGIMVDGLLTRNRAVTLFQLTITINTMNYGTFIK
jgi:hypothetical protein